MVQTHSITHDPELSIVIPVYNGARYIQDALESVAALSELIDSEVIVQNACSTDGTTAILDAFCAGREHWYHYNEQDAGQSDAINTGMSRAKGRWVTWLCADDVLLPAVAEALTEADQAGADVVYGDGIFIPEQGVTPAIGTETWLPGALAKKRLIIQQPGTCIRRHIWQEAGGVNIDLNWLMDYDLFLRLESENTQFYRAKHFVAIARLHKDAKTSSGSIKRLFEVWSILFHSHARRPQYFRLKPYMVYLFEYVIKSLEARNVKPRGITRKALLLLHYFFWILVRPQENADIQSRFQTVYQELASYIEHVAATQ